MHLVEWLRTACGEYVLEPIAVYRARGEHPWPLVGRDERDLADQLEAGGHFLPLPKEPAALANVLEVSLVSFVLSRLHAVPEAEGRRGTERGYPDIEISGAAFGGGYHALDVKVARRRKGGKDTQSRITLYTGNTYFRYPQLRWPGTFRPFQDYDSHLDLLALYTLNEDAIHRVDDLRLVVQESWRIASKKRSSTTREYIGAVTRIAALESGEGDFEEEEEFYRFWRRYGFRVGKAVQQQLDRLLAEQHEQGR